MMNRDEQSRSAAAVSDDQPGVLLKDLFGQVAGMLPAAGDPPGRRPDGSRAADGAGGPQLLEHRRGGRAPGSAPAAAPAVAGGLGRAAGPGYGGGLGGQPLDDQDAVLIVDETADEKSSADAVGAAASTAAPWAGSRCARWPSP